MFARCYRYFALRPYWLALLICALLLSWMLIKPGDKPVTEVQSGADKEKLPRVQVTRFTPQQITRTLTLYGKSEASRRAVIRAEVAGKIVAISAQKGRYVTANTDLAKIEKSALPQQLAQAEALLSERLLNFNAAKSLNARGLLDRAALAAANSLLLAAETRVKQLQLELQRTTIVAPFAGMVQEKLAEQGDYLQVGDALFALDSLDPIIIRGDVTEHDIGQLQLGQAVSATLLSQEKIFGKISYIAAYSDPQSNTFRVEAEFANGDFKIRSGMSAELSIPLYSVAAIYISPAVLALDAQGNLGVKLVKEGVVVFQGIDLVDADNDGVWLAGFSEAVDIITLGQGFVKPGDPVQAIAAEQ